MKKSHWFKQAWKDTGFKWISCFLLIGSVIFQLAIYWVDSSGIVGYDYEPMVWPEVIFIGWGFWLVVVFLWWLFVIKLKWQ